MKPLGQEILGCQGPKACPEGGAQGPGGHFGPLTPGREGQSLLSNALGPGQGPSPSVRAQRACIQGVSQFDFPRKDGCLTSQTSHAHFPPFAISEACRLLTQEGHMDGALSRGRHHRLQTWTYLHRGSKFNKTSPHCTARLCRHFPACLHQPQQEPGHLSAAGS